MTIKTKGRIATVLGSLATIMLFVIPLCLPDSIANNKVYASIYFVVFLCLVGWSNYTNEKISKMSVEDKREEKIKELLK
jgi:hypothetical protein